MEMTCKGDVAPYRQISPEMLPPTARAAHFHGLRVHNQIIAWSLDESAECDPIDWGWKVDDNTFKPVLTDLDVAPPEVKKVIRCKCKVTRSNPCSSRSCLCRKNGLKCTSLCWGCRGSECSNSDVSVIFLISDYNVEEIVTRFFSFNVDFPASIR